MVGSGGFIVCVSGPRVRQTTGSFLQFNAPPALHCLILAPYYTGGPSWLFGAAPGGKIWAIWPQHHRMPMSNLEAKKTSATWTTTKPIQLAWPPRFAPTSVSHPLSVLRSSHAKIRAGFLCYLLWVCTSVASASEAMLVEEQEVNGSGSPDTH